MKEKPLILLTGASGYIGGRLLSDLENRGEMVRCLERHPIYMRSRVVSETQIVRGDLLAPESLINALRGVDTAYYLVHSTGCGEDYAEKDRWAATNFAEAALEGGIRQIIYLGVLGHGEDPSPYVASRQEVGRILRGSGVPTMEFRASVIIGSGSLSYEMVRGCVERLPIMIAPRWVKSEAQPIAVEDVLSYLIQGLHRPEPENRIYEIGGSEISSYEDMMKEYARQRGLRRLIIPFPFFTPRLSSQWLSLVTPLYARVGLQLIEGVRNGSTVQNLEARKVFPVRPMGLREAVSRAMAKEDHQFAETHWSDALIDVVPGHHWWGLPVGTRRISPYFRVLPYPPGEVFAPIKRIGGDCGWYGYNWMWKIRGAMDRLIGGVGLRRGRRDPCDIRVGDAIDFWRVEKYEPGSLLLLFAEMKLPGRAWLHFEVRPDEEGSKVRMTALFDPIGILGRIYWYMVYPFHFLVFNSMFKGIVRTIERNRKERKA